MQPFIDGILAAGLPIALELIAAALGVVLLRASTAANKYFGVQIEARHRDAFLSAMMSGITAAMSRGLAGNAAIDFAIKHVEASTPDALAALKPTTQVMTNIASRYLTEASALLARQIQPSQDAG